MSDAARRFYLERVPSQCNRVLEQVLTEQGEEGPEYRALAAVNGTIEARVAGAPGSPFHLNITAGRMTAGDGPAHEPFAIVVHDAADLAAIEQESGDSALGFLGGLAGLGRELRLTRTLVDGLRRVQGTVRFSLTGEGGFRLLAHFGGGEPVEPPACELAIDAGVYEKLRSGAIDAQDAFMSGRVDVAGDLRIAMELALAVMSPDEDAPA
jgi:hypothetical protein